MKRLLLYGLCVFVIGALSVFAVYHAQQQAIYRTSPAGIIAESARVIAEGEDSFMLGNAIVTVLFSVVILALIGGAAWLAVTLRSQRRPQRRPQQRQQRYYYPRRHTQGFLRSSQPLTPAQQWMLEQDIQRLEQRQPYQHPENLYQEEEAPWA